MTSLPSDDAENPKQQPRPAPHPSGGRSDEDDDAVWGTTVGQWRQLYEAEKEYGMLDWQQEQIRQDLRDAGRISGAEPH
jgi:hypothetical protein